MLPKQITDSIWSFIFINSNSKSNSNSKTFYLPPELIKLIYSFIIRDYYVKIICKHCYNYNMVYKLIKYTTINLIQENLDTIIESLNISALRILVNSHIPSKYSLNFWAHYLQVLSININRLRFSHIVNNIGFRSVNGIKLKLVLDLWLQLCKKFNLKIFLKTKKFSKYINAKYILKINNYDQYLITPTIIQPFTQTNWINYNQARELLNGTFLVN